MTTQQQWDTSTPITDLIGATPEDTDDLRILNDLCIPQWLDQTISPYQVQSINQGGCEGGAYMPAVTYHQALETMHTYGDAVLHYIDSILGDLPQVPASLESWGGMAVYYLSTAVELWSHHTAVALADIDIKGDDQ